VFINVRGVKPPPTFEDLHFCHKAGKLGFGVYVDTATKTTHLGYPKHITEEVYEAESKVLKEREEKGDLVKYPEKKEAA